MREGWITVAGLFLILLGIVAYVDSPEGRLPDPIQPPAKKVEAPPPASIPGSEPVPAANGESAPAAHAPDDSKITAAAPENDAEKADDQVTPPAFVGPLVAPTFDIVRVERNGTAVITGRAAPGSKLTVVIDSNPVAVTHANARGEWSMVIASPLEAGPHDLKIKAADPGGEEEIFSQQLVSVGLSKKEGDEPIVVIMDKDEKASRSEGAGFKTGQDGRP